MYTPFENLPEDSKIWIYQSNRKFSDEEFNEIFPGKGIKTEAELRTALEAEIAQYWNAQSLNQLHDQLYHYLLDETKMEFPESFLTREFSHEF